MAVQASSSSSSQTSTILAATAAQSDADHTPPVTFHDMPEHPHNADTMSSATSTSSDFHTAVAGVAKPLGSWTHEVPKAPSPKAKAGAPRIDAPLLLTQPADDETSYAVEQAQVAASVAGAAGASRQPEIILAPSSPRATSPAGGSQGGFFSYISNFFSWLFECFCCCFSGRASDASESGAGTELRVVVPSAEGAGAASAAIPSANVEQQLKASIAKQLELLGVKCNTISYPFKAFALFFYEKQGTPIMLGENENISGFEWNVEDKSDIEGLLEKFQAFTPNAKQIGQVTRFKILICALKQDGDVLRANFDIFSNGNPAVEHLEIPCVSEEDFQKVVTANSGEFDKNLLSLSDYAVAFSQASEEAEGADNNDAGEGDAVEA